MSDHTPGPWQTRFVYRVIQSARKDPTLYMMTKHRSDWADARLMAASPDMLEAIKAVEWAGENINGRVCCPLCGNQEYQGHTDYCTLGNAIRKATEDT